MRDWDDRLDGTVPGEVGEDFHDFYARTYADIASQAIFLAGHRQNAEDAVQDAYVEALRHWPRVMRHPSPEGWVVTTMRRKLFRASGKWWSRWKRVELTVTASPSSSVEETAEALETLRALGLLPPRQRQVLVMRCQGMRSLEIAEDLGIAPGTVAGHLHQARAHLGLALGLPPDSGPSGDALLNSARPDALSSAVRSAAAWLCDGLRHDRSLRARARAGLLTVQRKGAR